MSRAFWLSLSFAMTIAAVCNAQEVLGVSSVFGKRYVLMDGTLLPPKFSRDSSFESPP